jgi:hypothetical protein
MRSDYLEHYEDTPEEVSFLVNELVPGVPRS